MKYNDNINYTVYKHTSPSNKVYIGITSLKPEQRWNKGEGYKKQVFYKAIQKYGWNNIKHEILFSGLSKEEAEHKEIELIQKYNSTNAKFGYNIDNGGNCTITHSEETRRKISIKNKGKIISNIQKEIIGKSQRISVCKYNLDGDYIKKYKSIKDASIDTNIKNSVNISMCCKGKLKTAGGYIWRYSDELITNEYIEWCNSSANGKINQYTLDGKFIKTWKNISEIVKKLNYDYSSIRRVCIGKNKMAYGYIWRYE